MFCKGIKNKKEILQYILHEDGMEEGEIYSLSIELVYVVPNKINNEYNDIKTISIVEYLERL